MENTLLLSPADGISKFESILGKTTPVGKKMLIEAIDQKQISTTSLLQLLPKGSKSSIHLPVLTGILKDFGIVMKYVSKKTDSYIEQNSLSITPNTRSIITADNLPLCLIGLPRSLNPWNDADIKRGSVNVKEMEALANEYLNHQFSHRSEHGDNDWYIHNVTDHKILDKETTYKLIYDAQHGDTTAKNLLIIHNQKLVLHIAKKLCGPQFDEYSSGIQFSDVVQEGFFGLNTAIEKFKLSTNLHLTTYAYHWISQSIRRALQNLNSAIRLPVHMQEQHIKFKKTQQLIEKQTGETPSAYEVGQIMGLNSVKTGSLEKSLQLRNVSSIDRPLGTNGEDGESNVSLEDMIADVSSNNAIKILDLKTIKEKIKQSLLSCLNEKEHYIICARFGLNDEKPKKLQEIGDEFNVTRERIRKIESIVLERLKEDPLLQQVAEEFLEGYKEKPTAILTTPKPPQPIVIREVTYVPEEACNNSPLTIIQVFEKIAQHYKVDGAFLYEESPEDSTIKTVQNIASYVVHILLGLSYKDIASKIGCTEEIITRRCNHAEDELKTSEFKKLKALFNN